MPDPISSLILSIFEQRKGAIVTKFVTKTGSLFKVKLFGRSQHLCFKGADFFIDALLV